MREKTFIKNTIIITAVMLTLAVASLFCYRSHRNKVSTVEVKGISERLVQADMAVLQISICNVGSDMHTLSTKRTKDRQIILEFLKKYDIYENDVIESGPTIYDSAPEALRANYSDRPEHNEREKQPRRISIDDKMVIYTPHIQHVKDISLGVSDLLEKGVCASVHTKYKFTKFQEVRLEMLAEAASSAQQSAIQFLKPLHKKPGKLLSMTQGGLSVASTIGNEWEEEKYIEKILRVVVHAKFSIETE